MLGGEIENGLPAVVAKGLPGLSASLSRGLSINDALIQALLLLMTVVGDTTVLYRHNLAVLKAVQQDATDIVQCGGMSTETGRNKICELNQGYIESNISPGGSANLLAVAYFLHAIENRKFSKNSDGNRSIEIRYKNSTAKSFAKAASEND